MAFKKTDHNVWLQNESVRLAEEERIRSEKEAEVAERIRIKDAKINRA